MKRRLSALLVFASLVVAGLSVAAAQPVHAANVPGDCDSTWHISAGVPFTTPTGGAKGYIFVGRYASPVSGGCNVWIATEVAMTVGGGGDGAVCAETYTTQNNWTDLTCQYQYIANQTSGAWVVTNARFVPTSIPGFGGDSGPQNLSGTAIRATGWAQYGFPYNSAW